MAQRDPDDRSRSSRADSKRAPAYRDLAIGLRLGGAAAELAFVTAAGGAAGWYLDRLWQTSPLCLLIGCGLGFVGGGYRLWVEAARVNRMIDQRERARQSEKERQADQEDRPHDER